MGGLRSIEVLEQIDFAQVDNAAALTAQTLVAAVPGHEIVVLGYAMVAAAAQTVTFRSDATDLTPAIPCGASGGVSYAGGIEAPAFRTAAGEALKVITSTADQLSGHLCYVLRYVG